MFLKDNKKRARKKARVRRKISGTAERPRLSVFRSLNHIYAQVIDDNNKNTLAAASTKDKELADELKTSKGKASKSKLVGMLLAKRVLDKGINAVVFDRSGYQYQGRIKALAEGAREGGLKF
ncbi:MAG: 50S ribosomal protein L18 [Ignavibacteria bacterium]|nr:50S ribosomal protein L18 [Ignavibacteria bacterium]